MKLQSNVVDLNYERGLGKAMVKFRVFPHTKEAVKAMQEDPTMDTYDRDILLCLVPITLPGETVVDLTSNPFNVMVRVSFSTRVPNMDE